MVKFIERKPDDIENIRYGHRGRVSYPILKSFLETGFYIAEMDLATSKRKAPTMYALLKSYITNHELPIKPLMRSGKLFLLRLDIDEDGKEIPDWKKIHDPVAQSEYPIETGGPITDEEIEERG